jgi:hypothetical protein
MDESIPDTTDGQPMHRRLVGFPVVRAGIDEAGAAVTGDNYIQRVLSRYAVEYSTDGSAAAAANDVLPTLRTWAGTELIEVVTCGSFAKRTAVAGTTHIDLLISLKSSAPSAREIHESLFRLAETRGWRPRCKSISVAIDYGGVRMDLVPARLQDGFRDYHEVWRSDVGAWTQTNLAMHTERVRDSGRTREVRALKIWRGNHDLYFPSLYLELTVLSALAHYGSHLAHNVQRVFGYIADRLPRAVVCDPANTNNCVSDSLSAEQKQALALQAAASYNSVSWDQVLW